jgi:hypothetical protein
MLDFKKPPKKKCFEAIGAYFIKENSSQEVDDKNFTLSGRDNAEGEIN